MKSSATGTDKPTIVKYFHKMSNIPQYKVTNAFIQWRIKRGPDWATAKGPHHLEGPQFLSR